MSAYALPSLFSVLLECLFAFLVLRYQQFYHSGPVHRAYWLLLASVVAMSAISLVGVFPDIRNTFMVKLWYISLICTIVSILLYVDKLCGVNRQLKYLQFAFALLLVIALLMTDTLIVGYKPHYYSIISVRGEYFYLLQLFVMFYACYSLSRLVYALVSKTAHTEKELAIIAITLIGFIPLCILGLIMLILLTFDIVIHNLLIIPICLAIFSFSVSYGVTNKRIFNVPMFLPFTRSWKKYAAIRALLMVGDNNNMVLDDKVNEFERALIMASYKKNGYDLNKTADELKISYSSLYYRIFKKHKERN